MAAAPAPAQFRAESVHFNKALSKQTRKDQGIFFTPYDARKKLLDKLQELHVQPQTILEPSFGSGEFLLDALERYATTTTDHPPPALFGVEKNQDMYQRTKAHPLLSKNNQVYLSQGDFLEYHECQESIDLVLGNPPYFVTKEKNPACMTGRGNIFVQFIYKCLTEHLAPRGVLAFVLPTSFYNCSYYEPCRKYIYEHATILYVETIQAAYYDTTQDTMILILRKEAPPPSLAPAPRPYFFEAAGNVYITPHAEALHELITGTTTLQQLGFSVKTGAVVWNQHKEKLRDDTGALVLYSGNIVENQLVLHNLGKGKKQYIQGFPKETTKGPAILVARGYGNSYKFSYAYVEEQIEFHGENHVNIIAPKTPQAKENLQRVLDSLENYKMQEFIRMFVGNGALSKTELETILPIF